MTRDEVRGQQALEKVDTLVKPQNIFVGTGTAAARKLYALEEKRAKIIKDCAEQWSKVCDVPESEFWNRAIPQALHDMLVAYGTEAGIVACESFLERHGWTVTRPPKKL